MRWSKLFIPTLRETPADARTPGLQLLIRAGYVRPCGTGAYAYLNLGERSLQKIAQVIRGEMERIEAQELHLPQNSTIKTVAGIAAAELRSYKQLPQRWYAVQHTTTLRLCLFDVDQTSLNVSHDLCRQAWSRAFDRCGVEYAITGEHGGSQSFVVFNESGHDFVVLCVACGYGAMVDKAASRPPTINDSDMAEACPELLYTPGVKTIAEVSSFDRRPEHDHIKSLLYISCGKPLMVLMTGNDELSEEKLSALLDDPEAHPARPEEVHDHTGAGPGSIGPVGFRQRIVSDARLDRRRNLISGANRDDYHLVNVTPGRDFQADFHDLRTVHAGDPCMCCGAPLKISRAVEIGRVSKLGSQHSKSVHVLQATGKDSLVEMASATMHIDRIAAVLADQRHDVDGMVLSSAVAPFDAIITIVNTKDAASVSAAEELYKRCLGDKLTVLLDDRDERPGVKFKDADLIGIPIRVNVGRKVPSGLVEVVQRSTHASTDVSITEAATFVRNKIRNELSRIEHEPPSVMR